MGAFGLLSKAVYLCHLDVAEPDYSGRALDLRGRQTRKPRVRADILNLETFVALALVGIAPISYHRIFIRQRKRGELKNARR